MSAVVYTFCDRCSKGATAGEKIRNCQGRGWAEWSEVHCVAVLGWEERPEGIVCPECLDEEAVKEGGSTS